MAKRCSAICDPDKGLPSAQSRCKANASQLYKGSWYCHHHYPPSAEKRYIARMRKQGAITRNVASEQGPALFEAIKTASKMALSDVPQYLRTEIQRIEKEVEYVTNYTGAEE